VWFNDGTNGSQLLAPDQRLAAVGYAMVAAGLAPGVTIPASAVTGTIPASQVATAPPGMALIPAGPFTMGDNLDGLSDAVPIKTTVSAFYMDVNLVSLSQWQAVKTYADANGYTFTNAGGGKGATHPVHSVNWRDCVKWCNA
jgi:formylglycine-generating enzyme required for sulfatase activity